MSEKTDKRISNTIVPMTAKEGLDKILSTDGAIERTIPLSTEQTLWLETLCETVGSKSQTLVRTVVTLQDYTVIMTIIPDHLTFDGSALLATTNGTPNTEKD